MLNELNVFLPTPLISKVTSNINSIFSIYYCADDMTRSKKFNLKKINEDKFIINESIEKSLIGNSNLYNKTLEKIKIERIEAIRKNLINNYFAFFFACL